MYQFHRPDRAVPFAESLGTLVALKDEGKIRHIGLCNVSERQIKQAQELTEIVSVQNRYNPVDRRSDDVVDLCTVEHIAFLPWAPIQDLDDRPAITQVAERRGATPHQVALAWLLARSDAMLPIPGTGSIAHLEENLAAAALRLSPTISPPSTRTSLASVRLAGTGFDAGMGIHDDLRQHIDGMKTEWAELSNLRHGCLCGEGSQGTVPIDGLDRCCEQHDADYGAVGHSADTMFTIDGLIKTAPADRALAACAGSADIVTDHEFSHPDPEGFRQRLIALFDLRAWFGEQLAAAQAAGEFMGDIYQDASTWVDDVIDGAADAIEAFKEWLRSVAPAITSPEPTPDDVRWGLQEHLNYLGQLGVSRAEVDVAAQESGVAPGQLESEGVDLSAVA